MAGISAFVRPWSSSTPNAAILVRQRIIFLYLWAVKYRFVRPRPRDAALRFLPSNKKTA
jgi:hypothetical protein